MLHIATKADISKMDLLSRRIEALDEMGDTGEHYIPCMHHCKALEELILNHIRAAARILHGAFCQSLNVTLFLQAEPAPFKITFERDN
jgi:hypothetical protein